MACPPAACTADADDAHSPGAADPDLASRGQRSAEADACHRREEADTLEQHNVENAERAHTSVDEQVRAARRQARQRLIRQYIAVSAVLLLLLAGVVSMFCIRAPWATNATPDASHESSALRLAAEGDCVEFSDYQQGDVVESDYVIGKRDFTFMAKIMASEVQYSMILARDRYGEVDGMFRVNMWSDGRLGATIGAAFADNKGLQFPSAVDYNGWGSSCTTTHPLPLYKEVHFCLVRRGLDWAIFLDGEHALPGGWTRQNPPDIMDLKFYKDKNLRVGSRLPPLPTIISLSSSNVQDPFPGTIRGAALHVGFAITEEQIRKGHVACSTELP